MRVRITYGIDLDDVINETTELLSKQAQPLHDTTNMIESLVSILTLSESENVCEFVSENIDLIREKLNAVDQSLNEVSNVLSGYAQATKNGIESVMPQQTEPESAGEAV